MYVSVTDLKLYLGLEGTGDDVLLTSLVESAQSIIDAYTNTTFESTAVSTRYFTWGEAMARGYRSLFPDEWLASSVGLVIVNGDGTVIPSSDYTLVPRNQPPFEEIRILWSSNIGVWTYSDNPEDAIAITGHWGWSLEAPGDIKHAARRLAAYLYRAKDAQVFDVTAFTEAGPMEIKAHLPSDVRETLDRYKRLVG